MWEGIFKKTSVTLIFFHHYIFYPLATQVHISLSKVYADILQLRVVLSINLSLNYAAYIFFCFFAMHHLWNVIFSFIVFHVQYALKIPLSWNFIGRKLTSVCWFSRTPQEKKGLGCVWAYGWSLIKWGSRCPWSAGREECSIYDLTISAGSICIDYQENWEPSSTR